MIGIGTYDGLEIMNADEDPLAHRETLRMQETESSYWENQIGEKKSRRIERRYVVRYTHA